MDFMLAKWDLLQVQDGNEVTYTNLQTGESMFCGVTSDRLPELLDFLISEGGGGFELIYQNGTMAGYLLPESSDAPPVSSYNFSFLQPQT